MSDIVIVLNKVKVSEFLQNGNTWGTMRHIIHVYYVTMYGAIWMLNNFL